MTDDRLCVALARYPSNIDRMTNYFEGRQKVACTIEMSDASVVLCFDTIAEANRFKRALA